MNTQDPYNIAEAEKARDATENELQREIKDLQREHAATSASYKSLNTEMQNTQSESQKARLDAYMKKQGAKLREIGLQLDIKSNKLKTMSLTDFMGNALEELSPTLRRTTMTDEQKVHVIRTHGMEKYKQIPY